ncbi:MAG: hypothetical protein Q8Q29_08470 [Actinomycetota bacterium]|nr:hypothetical protein [Actinomycetota bacterium]
MKLTNIYFSDDVVIDAEPDGKPDGRPGRVLVLGIPGMDEVHFVETPVGDRIEVRIVLASYNPKNPRADERGHVCRTLKKLGVW